MLLILLQTIHAYGRATSVKIWVWITESFFFNCFIAINNGCIWKLRQLTCCLAALWGSDFAGGVFAWRHLTKLISDRLLRQRNGLIIYNKIERDLVITKRIFNYYNTNLLLEITSKVQNVNQKYTFTHKLTTKCNFQMPSLFFSSTVTEWDAQDCGIFKGSEG